MCDKSTVTCRFLYIYHKRVDINDKYQHLYYHQLITANKRIT